ncbi:MAG: SAM-dependent DNA methyltransferase [Flavobacteriales bacterium]|nr:SAM-dependent DNA methyltransferase [Flavobacteriales bacterium]
MDHALHTRIVSFIWGIADDVLRDVYVRGKYRDVILPMTVLRRLDAVLEPTKKAVLEIKATLDKQKIVNQDEALRAVAGQAFYNTSAFTLRDLKNRANAQTLQADFLDYLDGFSPNVQEIFVNFNFRNQVPKLVKADALGYLIEKYLDPTINFSPNPVAQLPALDNHAMGTIFEELVRKFNEENNEEAGEHWTPRDVVKVMTKLMFMPIADQIESGTYLLYDCACGTGGMLTVAEETLKEIGTTHKKQVATHLYGQEINDETYAICKADMLMKGEGDGADNIVGGGERSTLSNDAFPGREFDFMLANPPYGKSWKKDLERMGGKKDMKDPRFIIDHDNDPEYSLITRSSDGQMLFLANMLSKMKKGTKLGSRIAEVHNGSSLFTGDAGQGESNIRRWIIENDWLDAIVALPLNIFYNTGIATYIWVLSNRKAEHRKGKVQLIDATQWSQPLRKNLGSKNCELGEDDIKRIVDTFLAFKETEQSKIFPNKALGYWKVKVERPLKLRAKFTRQAVDGLQIASGEEDLRTALYEEFGDVLGQDFASVKKQVEVWLDEQSNSSEEEDGDDDAPKAKAIPEKKRKKLLDPKTWERDLRMADIGGQLLKRFGNKEFTDLVALDAALDKAEKELKYTLSKPERKLLVNAISYREESATAVIKKVHKPGKVKADPIHGLFEATIEGKKAVVEYEQDSELRDYEQIPLLEEGGIEAFIQREVWPYAADAWVDEAATKIGYEVSFNRYFYKPQPLRSLEEIRKDIVALEKETEGLLQEIIS